MAFTPSGQLLLDKGWNHFNLFFFIFLGRGGSWAKSVPNQMMEPSSSSRRFSAVTFSNIRGSWSRSKMKETEWFEKGIRIKYFCRAHLIWHQTVWAQYKTAEHNPKNLSTKHWLLEMPFGFSGVILVMFELTIARLVTLLMAVLKIQNCQQQQADTFPHWVCMVLLVPNSHGFCYKIAVAQVFKIPYSTWRHVCVSRFCAL